MVDVREYNDRDGRSPYAAWFNHLNAQAAAKVTTSLTRLVQGNFSNVKASVPGCSSAASISDRIPRLFWQRRERLVLLLGGGTKKRQQQDIETALVRW
jgi:putative addiction module killer protein